MYTLFRSATLRQSLFNHGPVLIGSLAIAELFYKFGSFLLEALAFLATWFVLDALVSLIQGAFRPDEKPSDEPLGGS